MSGCQRRVTRDTCHAYIMMVRTQISLEDHDHARAKRRAAELGISLSELIRRALRKELGERAGSGDISELFGILDSGHTDTSQRVDELVSEAIFEDFMRGRTSS